MSDQIVIIIVGGVFVLWSGWASWTIATMKEEIGKLKINSDVSDLSKEFEKFEARIMSRLDHVDDQLAIFLRTEIDEFKAILKDKKIG